MHTVVFIPSHNTQYLGRTVSSALQDSHDKLTVLVVLNGKAKFDKLSIQDDRVVIQRMPIPFKGVGQAKKYCVDQYPDADIYIELDHDDILHKDAIKKIEQCFLDHPEVSLVYSDFHEIDENEKILEPRFSEYYGWEYGRVDGKHNYVKSFSTTPDAIGYIWYLPNHVRAFAGRHYRRTKGYNPDRVVLDDQELISELYLQGDFIHIKEPLYLQRIHTNQTQNQSDINKGIQTGTLDLFLEYIEPISLKWASRNGLLSIDLGGAHNPKEGYKTLDLHDADITHDVTQGLPFEDNSVGVIRAYDFLEHIPNKIHIWNEIHRVLAPNGVVLSMTPSSDGRGAYQDPTHCAYYNENSFWYLTQSTYWDYIPESTARFINGYTRTFFPSKFHQQHNIPYVQSILFAWKDKRIAGWRDVV